ncbi:MAG: EF-P lysine aminoacylase GenX [Deltaproteobacteria bacterium]|nr:EF-P lysine aminoacylase GenX [Deltaproteobacteria bacterium]
MAPGPQGRGRRLRERSQLLGTVRDYFFGGGFIEIEPSPVVERPGMELHIDSVEVGDRYLISSPEFQLKRLLVEGYRRIFAICRCFRAGESGHQHSIEFTMLEWYRAGEPLETIMTDCEALLLAVAEAVSGSAMLGVDGRDIDVSEPFERVTVAQLFRDHIGCALRGDETRDQLATALAGAGIDTGTAEHWDDLFYTAFVDRIEPALAARERPVFVIDWPKPLAALARPKPGNPAVVERFELYVGGVELANAFGELTDAAEQRRRFEAERAERAARGKPAYLLDERFLAALEAGMPESAGIALGIDRLAMLAIGAEHIAEVQAFGDGEV